MFRVERLDSGMRRNDEIMFRVEHLDSGIRRNDELDINQDIAQLWGRLRVPHPENAFNKQVAATALIYELTVVTRNHTEFRTFVPQGFVMA
jgi:predicted nucleic acid-binding protein